MCGLYLLLGERYSLLRVVRRRHWLQLSELGEMGEMRRVCSLWCFEVGCGLLVCEVCVFVVLGCN